jgi:hypothetical protein
MSPGVVDLLVDRGYRANPGEKTADYRLSYRECETAILCGLAR